jgi:hypothetical protein
MCSRCKVRVAHRVFQNGKALCGECYAANPDPNAALPVPATENGTKTQSEEQTMAEGTYERMCAGNCGRHLRKDSVGDKCNKCRKAADSLHTSAKSQPGTRGGGKVGHPAAPRVGRVLKHVGNGLVIELTDTIADALWRGYTLEQKAQAIRLISTAKET